MIDIDRADDLLDELGLTKKQRAVGVPSFSQQPEQAVVAAPSPVVASASEPAPVVEQPKMTLPSPVTAPKIKSVNPRVESAQNEVSTAQNELTRLQKTGSGISQIKNPFLRGLARVGDIAGNFILPVSPMIPGTEGHHQVLMNQQKTNIAEGEGVLGKEAQTAEEQARTEAITNPPEKPITSDLQLWIKQHTDPKTGQLTKPIEQFWKDKQAAETGKTADEQTYHYLIDNMKMNPAQAYAKLLEMKGENKPDTAATEKAAMQALLQKAAGNQPLNPEIMTSLKSLGNFINSSQNITPDERNKLMSHFVFSASPASQGSAATIRVKGLENARLTNAIDKNTGNLIIATADMINREPGRYIPAGEGTKALTKEAVFQDLHFNSGQTREALNSLENGFDAKQRAQLAILLRNPNPHSALDTFLNSSIASGLTEDQVNYITALASLQENALALRGVAGLGQGSDELRAAIMKTLPGAGTPNKEYGNRQLDLFDGTVKRLEHAVAHTGVESKETTPQNTDKPYAGKVLSVDTINAQAQKAGVSYEEAEADFVAKGGKVKR